MRGSMTETRHHLPDLGDLIGLTYESALDGQPWQVLIDRLADLHPGVSAQVVPYEGETFLPALAGSRNTPAVPGGTDFDRARFPRSPGEPTPAGTAPGHVGRTTQAFAEEDWLRTEVYRTFLAPEGCRHVISVNLGLLGARGTLVAFAIPEDPVAHAAVHDPLYDLLCQLSPHMVRAARIASELNAARRIAAEAGSVLDALALPMIVVDGGASVVFANAEGRRILEAGDLFRLTPSHRIAASEDNQAAFAAGLQQASGTGFPAAIRLEAPGVAVSCCIVPLREPGHHDRPPPRRQDPADRLLAIHIGRTASNMAAPEILARAFGLTAREAEICTALLEGQSPGAIAAQAGRSVKTVRNQIHSIHGKVGVTSSRELASALAVFWVIAAPEGRGAIPAATPSLP